MTGRNKKSTNKLGAQVAIAIVGLLHLAGAAMMMFSKGVWYELTLDLVPLNLILTTLIAVKFQEEYNTAFFRYLAIAFTVGYLAEVVGVHTGWLFGHYSYGKTLGIKVFKTPLLIGLNWFLITYCVGSLVGRLKIPTWVRWAAAVFLLILFDYFMEPVALRHDLWTWTDGNIPHSNYVGWMAVSAILMLFYFKSSLPQKNKVAGKIWLIQFAFFVLQNLI